MLKTTIRDSQARSGTDLSRINYMGSIKSAFLDAAALWMEELEGVMHLEMIEAWIILRKEMGLPPIAESSAERSRLLKEVRAMWSHLAHFHRRLFLAKHQTQFTDTDEFEINDAKNWSLGSERSETLIFQLRNDYDVLVKILRQIKHSVMRPSAWKALTVKCLDYKETPVIRFGEPWYCDRECPQPATVHIIR
jgi:hypothetical protein